MDKLPEKWWINIEDNPEARELVGKWLNDNSDLPKHNRLDVGYEKTNHEGLCYPSYYNSHLFTYLPSKDYKEITLQDFKTHVLKENNIGQKYKLSELTYPIAIHITSKEQHDKLKELDIPGYGSGYNYYLLGRGRSKTKYEGPSVGAGNYINIEFEDIVFPEEITKEVVKCDSLEEWNTVQKFCNKNYSYKLSKDGCIRLRDGLYWGISNKEAIQKEGYTVISFNDFKKEYLKEEPINTYGLKVGDKLPERVINKWTTINKNYLINNNVSFVNPFKWVEETGQFIGNREIEEFRLIDGCVGFLVSHTNKVYLKAEGFKEFMDNFDKPMPKPGEYWVYVRGINRNCLNKTDSIYKIGYNLDKPNKFNITQVWCNISTDQSDTAYSFNEMKDWRIATSEDLKVLEPKKQSLKGRYLRALIDSPNSISDAKKGDYFRIDDEYRNKCTLLKNNSTNWSCISDFNFELMPEGFNPTQLNNKVIDLTNTKIWIGDNPELSKQVQEKAFELGWKWWRDNKKVRNIQGTSLYFDSDKYITYSDSKTSDYFNNHKHKEIKPEDLGISYPIIVGETAGNIPNSQFYAIRYDPFVTEIKPKIDEIVLLKQIKKITLDTNVNKVASINTELVKPKTIIYF